ncbi:hypothetical protein RFF05_18045 [Bengtsoniella intestinalis]|uniref:hypothetical protein n=1 Tax=Bengtsoniella intestinalis TaxID=3073143 RepID=UPI00391FC20B
MNYYDKNGAEIKAGMYLRMEDGTVEQVYACSDGSGTADLGINASNEDYLRRQGLDVELNRECYPLSQFNLAMTELCQPVHSVVEHHIQTM